MIERPAKPHAARPAAEAFRAAEDLEPRLLLSGVTPAASLNDGFAPQYVIYNPAGGNSGVSTQGADSAPSEFSPLGSASRVGLTPQQIRTAYGIDSIVVGSLIGDGTGQTIVIVDAYDDPAFVSSSDPNYVNSDLYKFNQYFGLPDFGGPGQPTFTKLDQYGGTSYPAADTTGWSTEIALDVEWAHVIAPKANIVLIEANSNSDADLVWTAVNTARNLPGASVISMSFGSSEGSEDLSENSVFLTPVGHAGVTFLAASGDNGSPGLYPAYSPNVVAVGGTTLTLSGNNYVSETAWSGSGGGQSTSELAPVYQDGVQSSTKRQMPDVAFDANPNSGVAVYDSYGEGAATPWVQVGGTSLSAPCWAGLIAIVNQIRASQGLGPLDGQSQTLPGIYSLQAAGLHDITSGGNGGFLAGPGYDMVTGRGSPVANVLVPALAATNIPEPVVFYSANMDTNPLWTYQDQWAWGQPTGGSGNRGGPDPTSGHTGANVVGYNLSGGYSRINSTQFVTTSAINCSGRTGVALNFWRWLGVDSSNSDHANVQVSNNGSTWTTVFQNPSITINETAWSYQTYDISAVADNYSSVYIRWGMGTTNRQGNYCGWNIDDVTLSQTAGFSTGPRLTDPNISITSSPSGALGTYKIGDTVTARWSNTAGGDGNTGALAAANPVTVDFTQFGGPAALAATNNSGIWTASYAIVAGPIDSTNRNVSVRVTDLAGNVKTTADTTNLSVDNQPPSVTDPNISITSSGSGTLGTYKIGDTVTARWNNTAGGDNNPDALAALNPVTVNFTQFGGPAALAATDNSGLWTASYAIVAGTIDATNLNISVTVTDNAGNVTTTADTTNLSVDDLAPTAGIAAVTPDPRTTAVSQIAIVFSEPVSGFALSDLELTRSGGGDLLTGSQTLDTSDNVTWLLGNLSGITGTPGLYVLGLAAGGSGIVDDAGNPLAGDASVEWLFNSTVAGRYVFYNGSALDGNDPTVNANDDAAIATDKQALLPGQQATPANVTSFSRGINGIMVDVTGLADPAGLTVANIGDYFVFKAGNDNDPSAWDIAAVPSAVLVRQGAGVGGGDRVTIVWAGGAIRNRWLQVRVLSQANGGGTGLAGDDVFYFGNLTGDVNGDAVVDAADYMALKMALRTGAASPAGSVDFNESSTVDYGDLAAVTGSFGQSIDMAFSAPQQIAAAAPAMSAMTAVAPEAAATPAAAAEPEPAAPLPADPALTLTAAAEPEPAAPLPAEPALTLTAVTMTDSPATPPAASYTFQDAAAVLDALGASQPSPLAATATTAPPTYAEPSPPLAGRAETLFTFLWPARSAGKAGQEALADALALAGPWRTSDSAGHEPPDEHWMTSLTVDIAGKPRKGLLDPVSLDLLAASR